MDADADDFLQTRPGVGQGEAIVEEVQEAWGPLGAEIALAIEPGVDRAKLCEGADVEDDSDGEPDACLEQAICAVVAVAEEPAIAEAGDLEEGGSAMRR